MEWPENEPAAQCGTSEPSEKDPTFDKACVRANLIDSRSNGTIKHSEYGLCATCMSFIYQRARYGKEFVACAAMRNREYGYTRRPNCTDPIIDCSWYDEKGRPTLREMWLMATPIEDKQRHKIGFHQTNRTGGEGPG